MGKIISVVSNLKIATKMILLVCLTSIVLLAAEFFGRSIVYEAYDEALYHSTIQTLVSYVERIETEIIKADSTTVNILSDKSIQKYLIEVKRHPEWDRISLTKYLVEMQPLLRDYKNVGQYCDVLDIWLSEGTFVQNAVNMTSEREMELGVIFMQIDFEKIIDQMNKNYKNIGIEPQMSVYKAGACIYSTTETEIDIEKLRNSSGWEIIDKQFVVYTVSNETGWEFCVSVPYAQIKERVEDSEQTSVTMTVAVTILANVICAMLVRTVVRGINELVEKFNDFKRGILSGGEKKQKYSNRTDEVGKLHYEFDKMAGEYMRMTDEKYKNTLLLKEAQLNQLQKQMQPHFLFNALSTIVWTAYENDDEETAQLADALGEMLRQSMDSRKEITLREELKLVESYVYIQKKRFDERFSMEVSIPEELMETEVPSFTLQPIVENVMKHVVERKLGFCYIRLSGRRKGSAVEIDVEDSGNCLDVDILRKLAKGETRARGNGVGMRNIDQRIRLKYGAQYGLRLSRSEGFSRVTVCLPVNAPKTEKNSGGGNDGCRR